MSTPTSSTRETRPPSQSSRDQLVLQVANVALAGRVLAIEIFELQNALLTKGTGTPSSPLRPTSQPSTPPLSSARATGFRVAARDDVENEYSLFVNRQKAEYLYRAVYPVEAAGNEVITSEAMANGILAHLSIIGNRQRDVGKLICREPEAHFEKKTRVVPASTPPEKQKNPHLPSKRQDQRAVRMQKTSKRAMEAAAQAVRRPYPDLSGDDESAGSEVESNKLDRKSSEASILHRMAVADSKTMWKAELETNYEESDHTSLLVENDTESNFHKTQQYALPPGLSPVKRALPERKTKHKDLEERRQKGRQQRIMVVHAAQETPEIGLTQAESSYPSLFEESDHDGEASRRSSMVTASSTKNTVKQPRASSAPRSSVIVGNAYGLKNLHDSEPPEPEQFLRRRTWNAHRSVLRKDHWQDEIPGMGIEITDHRPTLQTPPSRLDALLSTARRVMMVNAVGSLPRNSSNPQLVPEKKEYSRSTTPELNLYSAVLGASHSVPDLQSPKLQRSINECPINAEPEKQARTSKLPVSDENAPSTGDHATEEQLAEPNEQNGPRPRSQSTIIEPKSKMSTSSEHQSPVLLYEAAVPVSPLTAIPVTMGHNLLVQNNVRPRSNSVGSERIVRLAPLPNTAKPPVQEFLATVEPVTTNLVPSTQDNATTADKEPSAPTSDPEVLLSPSSDFAAEANEDFSAEKGEDCAIDSPFVVELSSPQCFEEVLRANAGILLSTTDAGVAIDIGNKTFEAHEAVQDNVEQDASSLPTTRQGCWEDPTPAISSEVKDAETTDVINDDNEVSMAMESNGELVQSDQGRSEAVVAEITNPLEEGEFELVNLIVKPDKDQNEQVREEVSGDVVEGTLVDREDTDINVAVLRQDENQDNSIVASTDPISYSTIVETVTLHNSTASETLEQSKNGEDALKSDAHLGEELRDRDTSENTQSIRSAAEIDDHAQNIEDDINISYGHAANSTEEIKSMQITSGNDNATSNFVEATEDQNNNSTSSNHDTHEQMADSSEIGQSERVATATACLSEGDPDKSFDKDRSTDKSLSIGDVSTPDQTSSQLHETPSLGMKCESMDTMMLIAESKIDQELVHPEEEFVQTAIEDAKENCKEPLQSSQVIQCGEDIDVIVTLEQTQLAVSSSEIENSSKTARKKSLSPSKKPGPASNVIQTKPVSKVVDSRRRSTVAQVPDAPVEVLPIPKLARRRTAEDVKRRGKNSQRMSIADHSHLLSGLVASVVKPPLKAPVEKSSDEVLRSISKRQISSKRQSSHSFGSPQSNYHKKWGKWMVGRNIIEKVGCLQLEDLVIADPRNEENLLKLGLRYTRWPGTSLPGILMLEHAVLLQKTPARTQDYWFWLGSAHLDIFMRHRKYLPVARFHLSKSIWAFTSAFAYMESLADPMRLLRYAIGLFWYKCDGNLEKTRDIFHELFSRFVSFCEKDLPNLLFLQFQVFHRLKHYVDAIECMSKILDLRERPSQQPVSSLSSTNTMAHLSVYDTADYRLMLMQCQQASGDYVLAAQSLSTVLKLKSMQQATTLKDEEYFDLWFSLGEKCFHHEDYALALEYYAIALNFAKQSQALAAIHYNLGLCFQSLGEDGKCVTEYKRARTANRHVPPLVSLTELSLPYDERFALLLQKSVGQIIEEVRVELYGKAVKRLQRVFRQSKRNLNVNVDTNTADSPLTKMPSLTKRRLSIAIARNPSALVRIEDTAEETEANEVENSQPKPVAVGDNQGSKLEDSALDFVERRHESFLERKQAIMEEMAELLVNPQYRGREVSPSSQSKARLKADTQLRSGMLSTEKDRLDVRRKESMEAFRQLGYVSSTMPWIEFWERLLSLAPDLYESRQALYGSIARIRGRLSLVTDEVAFCALAESIGNVHEAAEKLHDASYERELTYVCAVIEVAKQLERDFPIESTQLDAHQHPRVSLPTISSPRADQSSVLSPVGAPASRRVVLPPYSPTRSTSATTSTTKPKKRLRMNQMLNIHFEEHVQQQEAAIAITEATGGFVQPHPRMEKLMVLQNFRQTNNVLLRSQLAFGSEKSAT